MNEDALYYRKCVENALYDRKRELVIVELKELYYYTESKELFEIINKLEKMKIGD